MAKKTKKKALVKNSPVFEILAFSQITAQIDDQTVSIVPGKNHIVYTESAKLARLAQHNGAKLTALDKLPRGAKLLEYQIREEIVADSVDEDIEPDSVEPDKIPAEDSTDPNGASILDSLTPDQLESIKRKLKGVE